MRGGAVVARQAHNLEVGGSTPPPATQTEIDVRSEWAVRTRLHELEAEMVDQAKKCSKEGY